MEELVDLSRSESHSCSHAIQCDCAWCRLPSSASFVIPFKNPRARPRNGNHDLLVRYQRSSFECLTLRIDFQDLHSDLSGGSPRGAVRKASPVPEAAGLCSQIPMSATQPEGMAACSSGNKASTESQPFLPFPVVFCITLALISCQTKQGGAQRV